MFLADECYLMKIVYPSLKKGVWSYDYLNELINNFKKLADRKIKLVSNNFCKVLEFQIKVLTDEFFEKQATCFEEILKNSETYDPKM